MLTSIKNTIFGIKMITLSDKQITDLNEFLKKIGIPTLNILKEFNIENAR